MADHGWQAPAAAGSGIDHRADIAPELVGQVHPVRYDPETGRLDVRPTSPAYATQMRLLQPQMIARINAKTGTKTVRSLRVLPPGTTITTTMTAPASPAPTTALAGPAAKQKHVQEPGQVRTRETASAGYRSALATHQAARVREADVAMRQQMQQAIDSTGVPLRLALANPGEEFFD